MAAWILFAAVVTVCVAEDVKRQSCANFCIGLYSPVCGSDGKTYSNQCFFDIALCHDHTLTVAHPGVCGGNGGIVVNKKAVILPASSGDCPNFFCIALYDPVCGTDGKTYSNACYLTSTYCHGEVTVAHHGACGELVVSKKAAAANPLIAVGCPMMMCLDMYDPVCGSDGVTYSNMCYLHSKYCHGEVTVSYKGACAGDIIV